MTTMNIKRGSMADIKRQRSFENRTITPLRAFADGVAFIVICALIVVFCAI